MSDNKTPENKQKFNPIKSPYVYGNPIKSKEMFFGREDDFKNIKKRLIPEGGPHVVLLIGGRRSGKTSILYQIWEGRLEEIGETVWCDFHELKPKIHTNEDFVREIGRAVLKNPIFQDLESAFFDNFTQDTASECLQLLLKKCLRLIAPKKLLILCDEFDTIEELFENKMLSKEALLWAKAALNLPVYFIMTSSHEYREEHISDTFRNHSETTTIAEFSERDTYALIEKPCPQLHYHPEALKKNYRLSGGFPFYIQKICSELISQVNDTLKRTDINAVELNIRSIEYSIFLPCNNDDLLHDVNEKIAEIKGAAFYDKLYKKYFGVNKDKIQVSSLGDCNNCYVVKHGENLGMIN
jgi:predicted AAA+ superfamily ATPase